MTGSPMTSPERFDCRIPISTGPDWQTIRPGGSTRCAFDTPFHFYYREGTSPSRLLVYFQGGGACWGWVSCSGMFDTAVTDGELNGLGGIFDSANPENPFRDHAVVFIPYCTGDVHVGDTIASYGEASWNPRPVRHRGYENVRAVLDWLSERLPRPDRVVVAGASAGAYGALFHAPNVAALYPAADLTVIQDSGVPLLHDYSGVLEARGAGRKLRELWGGGGVGAGGPITLEAAHAELVRRRPEARVAQITTDRDEVQSAFHMVPGSHGWRDATLGLLRELDGRLPTFRAFVLSGTAHGLMRTDRFYALGEDGVRLRDWIADLVEGRSVASHYCERCE